MGWLGILRADFEIVQLLEKRKGAKVFSIFCSALRRKDFIFDKIV